MKYLRFFLVLALPMMFIMGCSKMDTIQDIQNENVTLKAAKGIDLNGPHFELNLLGKKGLWNDNEYNNPERHTIFIPRDTEGWNILLNQPNNLNLPSLPGVRIDMTQGADFAVLDGTVFDGDKAEFQLGPGKYQIYVAMRGKKNVDPAYIAGWLEALQTTTALDLTTTELWYYQCIGTVTVTRKWTNITGLFTINDTEAGDLPFDPALGTEQWIFDYMNWLGQQTITLGDGSVITYSELAYFWQLVNHGSQLIKVRFYPV